MPAPAFSIGAAAQPQRLFLTPGPIATAAGLVPSDRSQTSQPVAAGPRRALVHDGRVTYATSKSFAGAPLRTPAWATTRPAQPHPAVALAEASGSSDGAASTGLKLIGWIGCPFTQRVWLALHARGIEHEIEWIDPLNKPDWFLKLNPKGQVPVLVHRGRHLRESLVQIYYLEEAFPPTPASPSLLPGDAFDRAQVRLWVEWCGGELNPAVMALLRAAEEADRPRLAEAVAEKLRHLAAALPAAPAFNAPSLTLADCVLVPVLQRLELVGRPWRGYGIPDGPEFEAVRAYFDRMEGSAAVRAASFERGCLLDYYTRVWLRH